VAVFRDHTGKLIAFTRENVKGAGNESVFKGRGEFVGSVDANATRRPDGLLVSTGWNPGVLVKRPKA
jgi:hypothetical protein